MESRVSIEAKTFQAHVIVLEDHDETADCICKELIKDGKVVSVAKDLKEFENLIKAENKADVCSIDWNINKKHVGLTALSLIRTHEKDAGKVVYSAYVDPRIENAALSGGADFVLRKIGANYDEYLEEVEKAAKLGISRHISRRLSELGHPLDISFTPSSEEENLLWTQARQLAREKTLAGEDDELIQLLKRRGWWISFDAMFYSNLPFGEKLILLLDYVGAKAEDVAQFFECSLADVQKILKDKKVSAIFEERADELLSILAYVLRLSNYEPELMPHYWTVTNLFGGSLSSPPWDAHGLHEYLKSSGVTGIEEALFWIRSH